MKSICVTNSGKLISLISSDLFLIEKGLAVFPIMIAVPFINLWAGFLLSDIIGLNYTLLVLAFWVFNMCIQWFSSTRFKKFKGAESAINDERLKHINDLVVGCRTIKCYGWENHYVDKINEVRKRQRVAVIKVNIMQSLGNAFF